MPKRPIASLVNGRVRLRLLEEADLPMTLAWRNQDHTRKWFVHSEVISAEQHRAWYAQYKDKDDDFVFIIEETESLKRPVGQVALYRVDWCTGRAEFGRLIIAGEDARGLGLARLATTRLLAEAHDTLGLTDVYLSVLENNTAALRVYKACGFRITGRNDQAVLMSTGIGNDIRR